MGSLKRSRPSHHGQRSVVPAPPDQTDAELTLTGTDADNRSFYISRESIGARHGRSQW